jgi:hypothetical protein
VECLFFRRDDARLVGMTEKMSPPALGEIAPDFSLPDSQGNSVRLADACAQSPLVLVF